MPRVSHTRAEWLAIAHELAAVHGAPVPPGLAERLRALLRHASGDWDGEPYVLELDAMSAEAVMTIHAALAKHHPNAEQRAASVAEAGLIVADHRRRAHP